MNLLLLSAGVLSIVVGMVHSILGELLIFKKLRKNSIIPTVATEPLLERNVRILWATWHVASFFGWALGAILIQYASLETAGSSIIVQGIAFAMFTAGTLVFIATKAKHPGWIGLCGIAILCWLA